MRRLATDACSLRSGHLLDPTITTFCAKLKMELLPKLEEAGKETDKG